MAWPVADEYNEAILDPTSCFEDETLRQATITVSAAGMVQPISGGFANIYRLKSKDRAYAVKCFLRESADHAVRYECIRKALTGASLPYFTNFDYLLKGIFVKGRWYPVLKMDWEDGDALDSYIFKNVSNHSSLSFLAKEFKALAGRLSQASMAHGDLQHGNILVEGNRLRLIDYDAFFVPALAGKQSSELGHPNYQHPRRTISHFDRDTDSFSAWSIYTSLHCLSIDPTLWTKLAGGDECLLFRAADYGDPLSSYAFSVLEQHESPAVKNAARLFRSLCEKPIEQIPSLLEGLSQPVDLVPLRRISSVPAWIKRLPTEEEKNDPKGALEPLASYRAYNEAVRWPQISFEDYELSHGTCILEDTKVGRNGRVYHFRCRKRHVAVKCFSYDLPDREGRFKQIASALEHPALRPYVSRIEYLPQGIKVLGDWYPILKMDWFDGRSLGQMASQPVPVSEATASYLADQFAELIKAFKAAGVAHGDLELANLIFVNNDLKVVDYDNFFVPSLARMKSPDTGTPGYQHPARTVNDFGPHIDNFSAWLTHAFIKYIAVKPLLHELAELCIQDESQTTNHRTVLRALENDREKEVRQLGSMLRVLLHQPMSTVPPLNTEPGFEDDLNRRTTGRHEPAAHNPFIKRRPKQ